MHVSCHKMKFSLDTTLPLLVVAFLLPLCRARLWCENDDNFGLKPKVPGNLGQICHEFSNIIDPHKKDAATEKGLGEEIRVGKYIMYRMKYEEIPDANYKLHLVADLKTADGRVTMNTKLYLTNNTIKVVETTYFVSMDDTKQTTNQRIIQFGYGSAPNSLKATVCHCTDAKVKANFLAKIKEWYPDADISCSTKPM